MEKYIGDIYMITNVLGKYKDCTGMNKYAVSSILAKKDAYLVKVSDDTYMDLDGHDEETILDYYESIKNQKDTNVLLNTKEGIYSPFCGELYVDNIRKSKIIKLRIDKR